MVNSQPRAIVIGSSAGGLAAIEQLLPAFPADFSLPIFIVQHQSDDSENTGFLAEYYNERCALTVLEAIHGLPIQAGQVYLSVPGYHLQVERVGCISLSTAPPIKYAIPCIDVLFETAVECYRSQLIGVILTGMGDDGVFGLQYIKQMGGLTVVQDPDTAEARSMPDTAISRVAVDHVLNLEQVGRFLAGFAHG